MSPGVSNIGRAFSNPANLGVTASQALPAYDMAGDVTDMEPVAEGDSYSLATTATLDSVLKVGDVPPPPPPVKKQWGIYVFQVPGHGLDPDYARMNNQLAVKGTTTEAHIVLRGVDANGRLVNFSAQTTDAENNGLFDQYSSGPAAGQYLEKHILSQDAMATFLTETAKQFPAEHVVVSFEGHSGELRQFIPEIHAALAMLATQLGKPIDILLFDSCFMAQIEIATEFSNVAKFLVASQEGVVKFRSFPLISRWLAKDGQTTPKELADLIARNNKEFTFSAIDLGKVDALNQAMKGLGEVILTISDNKVFKAIRKAVRGATGYYTEGLFSSTHFSNTVDIYGYIRGIEKNPYLRKYFPGVTDAAAMVLKAHGKKGEDLIVWERHASKTDQYVLDYTDVRGSHGLSIHQRITPKWLWNAYTHLKDSAFNKATGWDKVTDHITSQRTLVYLTASVFSFLGGAVTAGVNNGIQRGMEIWEETKRKLSHVTS